MPFNKTFNNDKTARVPATDQTAFGQYVEDHFDEVDVDLSNIETTTDQIEIDVAAAQTDATQALADAAAASTGAVQADGSVALTGTLDAGAQRIANAADGTNAQDLVTKAQLDAVAAHPDDDVETVTGTAVDVTDPRNPVVDLQTAAQTSYDNVASGLTATDTKAAIDELAAVANHPDDDVETVTGTAVDVTDPRNPVVNLQTSAQTSYDNVASGLTATDAKAALDELAANSHADDDVEGVTGAGVDNADARNPVVRTSASGVEGTIDLDVVEKQRIFASDTDVGPATAGEPTEPEMNTWAALNPAARKDRTVYYTGTDTNTDTITHVFELDGAGQATLSRSPSAADNLGDHVATQDLDLAGNNVISTSADDIGVSTAQQGANGNSGGLSVRSGAIIGNGGYSGGIEIAPGDHTLADAVQAKSGIQGDVVIHGADGIVATTARAGGDVVVRGGDTANAEDGGDVQLRVGNSATGADGKILVQTPNILAGTATAGQVPLLVNQVTGEIEFGSAPSDAWTFSTDGMNAQPGDQIMHQSGHTINIPATNAANNGQVIRLASAAADWDATAQSGGVWQENVADTLNYGGQPIFAGADVVNLVSDFANNQWLVLVGGSGTQDVDQTVDTFAELPGFASVAVGYRVNVVNDGDASTIYIATGPVGGTPSAWLKLATEHAALEIAADPSPALPRRRYSANYAADGSFSLPTLANLAVGETIEITNANGARMTFTPQAGERMDLGSGNITVDGTKHFDSAGQRIVAEKANDGANPYWVVGPNLVTANLQQPINLRWDGLGSAPSANFQVTESGSYYVHGVLGVDVAPSGAGLFRADVELQDVDAGNTVVATLLGDGRSANNLDGRSIGLGGQSVSLVAGVNYRLVPANPGHVDAFGWASVHVIPTPSTYQTGTLIAGPIVEYHGIFNTSGAADTFVPSRSGEYRIRQSLVNTDNNIFFNVGTTPSGTEIVDGVAQRLDQANLLRKHVEDRVTLTAGTTYHLTSLWGGGTTFGTALLDIVLNEHPLAAIRAEDAQVTNLTEYAAQGAVGTGGTTIDVTVTDAGDYELFYVVGVSGTLPSGAGVAGHSIIGSTLGTVMGSTVTVTPGSGFGHSEFNPRVTLPAGEVLTMSATDFGSGPFSHNACRLVARRIPTRVVY